MIHGLREKPTDLFWETRPPGVGRLDSTVNSMFKESDVKLNKVGRCILAKVDKPSHLSVGGVTLFPRGSPHGHPPNMLRLVLAPTIAYLNGADSRERERENTIDETKKSMEKD